MSTALTAFRAQVDYLIAAADAELAQAAREAVVKAAVERYSRDSPDKHIDDVKGDGGKYYELASALSDWVEGFSRITQIEYPAANIAADETPQYLEPEDWRDDYEDSTKRYLYLPNHAPAATETMRITYTVPYVWSGNPEATTTPEGDFHAICYLTASICCQSLAAKYAKISDSTVAADSAAHVTKSAEYARRAEEFRAMYEQHLGLGAEQRVQGAADFVDWDTEPGWPAGRQFVFHGKGTR